MDIEQMKKIIRKDFNIKENINPPFTGELRRRHRSTRNKIYVLFKKFGYSCGAEIGVYRGANAKNILKQVPDTKLYLIDVWDPQVKKMNRYYKQVKEIMQPYNVEVMRMPSMQAVTQFEDCSLDFIYIDAAHDFDNVMLDLIYWVPKVKVGGMICGDDYNVMAYGVTKAVNSYTFAHGIRDV
ncbi:MAG: hypothetical protein GWN16_02750, partial [Calditrichae bacterium]|nr:hypothetical protein [Calditrichia bacterium]